MNPFHCSPAKPWGVHPAVRNDEDCRRCGWTAPGPIGDARAGAAEAADALAAARGWTLIAGGERCGARQETQPERRAAA